MGWLRWLLGLQPKLRVLSDSEIKRAVRVERKYTMVGDVGPGRVKR